jgi:hypothetical protein
MLCVFLSYFTLMQYILKTLLTEYEDIATYKTRQ